MAHAFTNLLYHIVFATKERQPWLTPALRPDLWAYLAGVIREEGGIALIVNGVDDHVHILAKLRPDRAVSDVVSAVKSRSSGWIHRTRPDVPAFAWQTGYGGFTVSQSQVERVRLYIANQEEHHRRVPFRTEFRQLLLAHGFDPDEEAMWQ
ncbi:MAG TPA: IS200/IS605 family transposase [Gemmataceae bacterium]|jgi:REP element-mobilizing transposase RayT